MAVVLLVPIIRFLSGNAIQGISCPNKHSIAYSFIWFHSNASFLGYFCFNCHWCWIDVVWSREVGFPPLFSGLGWVSFLKQKGRTEGDYSLLAHLWALIMRTLQKKTFISHVCVCFFPPIINEWPHNVICSNWDVFIFPLFFGSFLLDQ